MKFQFLLIFYGLTVKLKAWGLYTAKIDEKDKKVQIIDSKKISKCFKVVVNTFPRYKVKKMKVSKKPFELKSLFLSCVMYANIKEHYEPSETSKKKIFEKSVNC